MKTQCPFDPTVYANVPMGMFHCEICGEMQLAGVPHLPSIIEISKEEYDSVLKYNEEIRVVIKEKYA
jgi:hypothetical protein